MTENEVETAKTLFRVLSKHDGRVDGFARNVEIGLPVAIFEGGGWCLIGDLLSHWEIAEQTNEAY